MEAVGLCKIGARPPLYYSEPLSLTHIIKLPFHQTFLTLRTQYGARQRRGEVTDTLV